MNSTRSVWRRKVYPFNEKPSTDLDIEKNKKGIVESINKNHNNNIQNE